MEKYLTVILNYKYRSALTKLRLCNRPLLIETCRHSRIDTMIEDELHFLIQCPIYKEIRDKHFPPTVLYNTQISDKENVYISDKENVYISDKENVYVYMCVRAIAEGLAEEKLAEEKLAEEKLATEKLATEKFGHGKIWPRKNWPRKIYPKFAKFVQIKTVFKQADGKKENLT